MDVLERICYPDMIRYIEDRHEMGKYYYIIREICYLDMTR